MSRRPVPLSGDDVRTCLQAAVLAAGGQRAWAARHGLNQSHVAKLIAGKRAPGDRVLSLLGLRELPPAYVPASVEDRP
ncbi:hypothetical protein MKK69_22885 [Methylobacterium sp. J-026]|uniref:hypothetical protein n=1 Tax=unclassified Methylobacterium TaxID=2615210 RepID=UPI0011CB333B|nr:MULTISPECIES: hypothetical protein [unclassified Methylobacterium]MCJ2136861.1 hypothetical protein [Methylobacterium sp. J-026]TXM71125.1 hypothetical protein FV229_00135 [Methylobacterium sp. WL120]